MVSRRPYLISLFLFVMILFVILNIYLIRILYYEMETKSLTIEKESSDIISQIINGVHYLNPTYKVSHNDSEKTIFELLNYLKPDKHFLSYSLIANITKEWPRGNKLYPVNNTLVGSLLHALSTSPIMFSGLASKGTQLKLLLHLEGGLKAIFKPRWYESNFVIEGPVYAGKDRHNAEIAAFLLSALLDLRFAPIAIGRKIISSELLNTQSADLKKASIYNGKKYCFYGKCRYCTYKEPICEDSDGFIDGVMILHLDIDKRGGLLLRRSPWQRTYKSGVRAVWETNRDYCQSVKEYLTQGRILDLVDMSVVDFLLQNGDRHHYETFESRTVLLDNGKGLGNPNIDHIDILAPFYQCCMIRRVTWGRLLLFKGGALSKALEKLSFNDPLYPILTKAHLEALDRRLELIYSCYEYCKINVRNILK